MSLQAPSDAIRTTVAALRTEVDVGGVFKGVGPGPRHLLRCAPFLVPFFHLRFFRSCM